MEKGGGDPPLDHPLLEISRTLVLGRRPAPQEDADRRPSEHGRSLPLVDALGAELPGVIDPRRPLQAETGRESAGKTARRHRVHTNRAETAANTPRTAEAITL